MDIQFPEKKDKKKIEAELLLKSLLSGDDDSDSDSEHISLKKRDIYSDHTKLIYIAKLLLVNKMYKAVVSDLKVKHDVTDIDNILSANHKHNLGNYKQDYKNYHPDFKNVIFPENNKAMSYEFLSKKIPPITALSFAKTASKNNHRHHLMNDEILYLSAENRSYQNSIQDLKDMHPHLAPVIADISNELHYYFGPNFQQSFVQYIIEEEDYTIERVDYDMSFDYENYFVDDLERYSYDCVLLSMLLENTLSNIMDNIPEFDNYILDLINDELSELDYEQNMENALNQMAVNNYKVQPPFKEVMNRNIKKSQVFLVEQGRMKNIVTNYMPQYNTANFKRLPSPKMLKTRQINAAKLTLKNKAYTNIINRIMEHLPQYDAMITTIIKNEHEFVNKPEVKAHIKELIQSNTYEMKEPDFPKPNYSHILKYQPK